MRCRSTHLTPALLTYISYWDDGYWGTVWIKTWRVPQRNVKKGETGHCYTSWTWLNGSLGSHLKKKKKDSKETDIPHLFELFWWRSEFLERLYPSRIQICGAGIVMNALASKAQGWFERTWCDGTFNNSTTTSCHSIRCNFWWFHRSVSGSNCRSWRKIFKLS